MNFEEIERSYRTHTIEVTRKCNMKCNYCSTSSTKSNENMKENIAPKIVDFILSIPSNGIQIEFQGGEPFLNWEVVKLIIELIINKSRNNRKIDFILSSNFSLLDCKKLDFLARCGVNLCTSLDGPKDIHDLNRSSPNGSNYEIVTNWLRIIYRMVDAGIYPKMYYPDVVATITHNSLGYEEAIVNEFYKLGIRRFQIGPVECLGRAKSNWDRIGINAEEFISFYKKYLEHAIKLCKYRPVIYDRVSAVFLKYIHRKNRKKRINQLDYDIYGNIYPSNETRLLSCEGNTFFKIGNVKENNFNNLKQHLVKSLSARNTTYNHPLCLRCEHLSFCQGVRLSPCHYLAEQKFSCGQLPVSRRCAIFKGIFKILFDKMRNSKTSEILNHWAEIE